MAAAERAIVCVHRGAMADAEQAVAAGLAALGTLAEPGLRSLLNQHLAGVRIWQQKAAEAYELLRSIEHDVEATGDADRRIEFAQAFALVLEHLDRPAESAQWNRRAADTALAAGELPRAAQILLNLGIGWRDGGRLDQALATLREAQTVLAGLPEGAIPYSSLDLNLGIVLRDRGDFGAALDWLEQAIERGRAHVPGWVPLFLSHRAQLWIALGQLARAQQDLDAAAAVDAPPLAQGRRETVQAQLLALLGQDARPAFERAAALLGQGARALSRHRLALARCTVLDPADALATAGEVLDAATAAQRVGLMVGARTRLCQAAFALGHAAEAARHARQLATLADGDGSDDVYRVEVWLAAQRALATTDPALAAAVLAKASAWLERTARDHVPEPFRDSFMHRNPVNRELLSLAQRLLA
jgi:tetratricopeptide (TPR) repeat protein